MRADNGARRAVARSLLAGAVLALTAACASSGGSALLDARRPSDSVNATAGHIRLLGVRIEHPDDAEHIEGDNVGLFLTIANQSSEPDTLTAVSSVDARQIVFRDGDGPIEEEIDVTVPAEGVASLQYPGGPHLELVELGRNVRGASFLPVTFRFADAGTVTVYVFVRGFGRPTVSPLPPPTP
ncbi:copper chaperone PCu(A)C [Jiangella sp. DSM 45060]|uniref:copper chaperone PCu(A)C n=1 Tax=Jiangella sp. DSM 45060 TaxID=1798224 RepID=UPI00087A0864|nr:copper chaperone PCu(A)C [Jiangella sp. DSM 45060]SDT14426.1 Copper(I)-binding protein [Jiangella sp. DSM 45060]